MHLSSRFQSARPSGLQIRRLLAIAGLAALLLIVGNVLLTSIQTADMLTLPHHGFAPGESRRSLSGASRQGEDRRQRRGLLPNRIACQRFLSSTGRLQSAIV